MSYLDIVDNYIEKKTELATLEKEHGELVDRVNGLREEVKSLAGAIGDGKTPELTYRQWQVLMMVAVGNTHIEIGKALFISPETVRTHIRTTCKKLGANNRASMVHIAHQRGILR